VLVEKLLKPGAWLLLDDLSWVYRSDPHGMRERGVFFPLSEDERARPHVRDVFDLLVKTSPAFGAMRIEDNSWAWAQKGGGADRTLHVTTTRGLRAAVAVFLLTLAARLNVTLELKAEHLRRLRGDADLIQREIEERAQELARMRWVEGQTDDEARA
jgi:hypothetical protein